MDLPPDKTRIMRGQNLSKKWELVQHQRQVDEGVVANPSEYLEKLAAYIGDKKMLKKVFTCI